MQQIPIFYSGGATRCSNRELQNRAIRTVNGIIIASFQSEGNWIAELCSSLRTLETKDKEQKKKKGKRVQSRH